MADPLVSILIPFKNTAVYFEQCLHSIQKQDYKNWEVLAVNDHSDDASVSIIERFAKNDDRFKIHTNDASGIITALRMAYANSSGTYITRMDADDHMAAYRISSMVNALMKKGKGSVAIGQVHYFSEKGINEGYRKYEEWLNVLTATGTNYEEIYKECVIPSPCWMVHRTDLDACGAFIPNRYPEDYDLAFRFYEKGLTCIPCSEILHYWRDYDMRTSRTSAHYAQNNFLEIKLHYFLKLDYEPAKKLVVWGAGKKGKSIAKSLTERHIPFTWVCDNPKKIGKDIYGVCLAHYSELESIKMPQCIVTVANEGEQSAIRSFFDTLKQIPSQDYFFFC